MDSILIQSLKFDKRGMIPAVIKDASTSDIIGSYYIDNDGLAEILKTGSIALLEQMSEGSTLAGLTVIDVRVAEDGSSLTALVESTVSRDPGGNHAGAPAGHEHGAGTPDVGVVDIESLDFGIALNQLYELIADRKENLPAGSYTTYLFESGLDKILKKIAEESGEVIIAAKNPSKAEIIIELADLFYHLVVLMVDRDVKLSDVQAELSRRRGKSSLREDGGGTVRSKQG
ncbi:MAG TPA: phosphoribosyl-ATP diphosphatase [Blastocatellia bacterium]